tara:strand:+ start:28 stop:1149 length:1122 start_codon:yes stop_codon:yes gene_type:complete
MKKPERPPSFGFLFHQLTDFLIYDSGWYASESALIVDFERFARRPVENIGTDSQFYRKLNKGTLDQKNATKWIFNVLPEYNEENLAAEMKEFKDAVPGEWLKLHRFINGFSRSQPYGELSVFFGYISALCHVDRMLLEHRDPSPQDVSDVWLEISKWLLIKNDETVSNNMVVDYEVARVLHWASLLELYLRLSKPDISQRLDSGSRESMLDPFLPKLDAKGALKCSTALYMDNLMHKLLPIGCKKVDFYRAIARGRLDASELDMIDPPIESIKQADKRLRLGKKALTIGWVDESVGALTKLGPSKGIHDEDFDLCLYLIPFINMFDYIQRKLVNEGVASELVVDLFGRYHDHRKVVEDRFGSYKQTGVACHTK